MDKTPTAWYMPCPDCRGSGRGNVRHLFGEHLDPLWYCGNCGGTGEVRDWEFEAEQAAELEELMKEGMSKAVGRPKRQLPKRHLLIPIDGKKKQQDAAADDPHYD